MHLACNLSIEEDIASKLAELAIRLHKCGLSDPYKKVVRARDALLVILDERSVEGAEAVVCVEALPITNSLLPSGPPPQGKEIHRSEYAVA